MWCDIGDAGSARRSLLRADLDALPLEDPKDVPYRSQVPASATPAGTTSTPRSLLGAALALPMRPPDLPGRVRLVFQPAEEVMPGGALDVIEAGLLEPARLALALHCDPTLEVGRVGLRTGPITAASDMVEVIVDADRAGTPHGRTTRSIWSTRSGGC